jgi:hypothetical protein
MGTLLPTTLDVMFRQIAQSPEVESYFGPNIAEIQAGSLAEKGNYPLREPLEHGHDQGCTAVTLGKRGKSASMRGDIMSKFYFGQRILLAAGLSFAMAAGAVGLNQPQSENGITYISGGVGEGSEQAMREVANQYNLHLTFATADGSYLADIPVTIQDSKGNAVLDTVSPGPLFYANLTPGSYTVAASANGKTQTKRIEVQGHSARALNFAW